MSANLEPLRTHLKKFEFRQLFNRLGWDHLQSKPLVIPIGEEPYTLEAVAHKRGMVVYVCQPGSDGRIPDTITRRRIDREATRAHQEHLLIFVDGQHTTQRWQWVRRASRGQPSRFCSHLFHKDQPGDSLLQKLDGIRFKLSEEETLTQPEVPARVRQMFDIERVTKRFYEKFKQEHSAFLAFIEGIVSQGDREWYASVMLNRLMFVYFIQKQGFLNNDKNYLHSRLNDIRQKHGQNQFHSFYRQFLLRLFHEGFAKPTPRSKEVDTLLGKIPYLNGGIFDLHELEKNHTKIHIPDDAFERIFKFFESYDWHLEPQSPEYYVQHPNAKEEINPDVLGYIFEKYINQKQMGAYYTKEDITEYIAKNTILPFLLDTVAQKCPDAFRVGGPVWQLLQIEPDRYLYEPVRRGVDLPLPEDIAAGVADVNRREKWNRPAGEFALPTETWREHISRRQRCLELRQKLAVGEVHAVNDLITYNLDIRQFAEDVLATCDDGALLLAFWQALQSVSILDPACGSGAFLFAALNILQPLYDACLDRMQDLLDNQNQTEKSSFAEFRKVLYQMKSPLHPNRSYFILKSILVNNLYGVDIMKEAVEICKLRLFLKLVAQVERVEHLEPLPDIDFNIRPGNTLVGFATLEDVKRTILGTLHIDDRVEKEVAAIVKEAEYVDQAFKMFHEVQIVMGVQGSALAKAKQTLRQRLDGLNAQLHRYLAGEYGIDPDKPDDFAVWKDSHQPFHWFAEFHGIMKKGGFDVIIGNPPYVEYNKVRMHYTVHGYETLPCGNIYVFVVERCHNLIAKSGFCSFIVPLSLLCTDRMALARKKVMCTEFWAAAFDMRPASLFEGVAQRLCIFVSSHRPGQKPKCSVGGYRRWAAEERATLIPATQFTAIETAGDGSMPAPKMALKLEMSILSKINAPKLAEATDKMAHPIYIHRICRYFVKGLDFIPHFVGADGIKGKSEDYKEFRFRENDRSVILCLINSSLFYWFWRLHGDGFHCGYGDVYFMPFKSTIQKSAVKQLTALHSELMKSLVDHSTRKTISTKRGAIQYQEFYPAKSKLIMNEIDRVLAKHYGFTDEELDFIINYDIKYRMGQDAANDADEE